MAIQQNIDAYRVRNAIEIFQFWINIGTITNTTVAADNTVSAFRSRIVNASVHQEYVKEKRAMVEAIDEMSNLGIISDSILNPLTTTAGLMALLTAVNPSDDSDTARFTGSNTYSGNTKPSTAEIV